MPRARKHDQSGFALLLVLAMAAIVAIMLYLQMPRVVFEAQRAKEDLLIQRGEQYSRAIRLYFRKFGRYPPSLEALENTNNLRFLRRRYRDPMTGSDEWRIIHFAGGGFPDSVTLRPPTQPAKAGEGEPASAAATATEEAGSEQAQAQAQVQPQPRWRLGASDHVQLGTAPPPGPAAADQADSQGAEPASYPQPPPSSDAQGQVAGAPPPPPSNAEGQVAGAPPPPPSNAEGQVAGAPPPPPSFQPAVEEQVEGRQALAEPQPGVAPEGSAQPGAGQDQGQPRPPQVPSIPGLPLPYGRPGTFVGGVNLRAQPGGGLTAQPDGVNQGPMPSQSFAAGSGQTVTLGSQGAQTSTQQTVDPQALIGRMLRGEQGGQPGLGRGNLSIGGGIAGVASKFEGAGIKVYGDRTKYNEWEFIYDVRKDPSTAAGRGGAPLGPPTSLGGQAPTATGSTRR